MSVTVLERDAPARHLARGRRHARARRRGRVRRAGRRLLELGCARRRCGRLRRRARARSGVTSVCCGPARCWSRATTTRPASSSARSRSASRSGLRASDCARARRASSSLRWRRPCASHSRRPTTTRSIRGSCSRRCARACERPAWSCASTRRWRARAGRRRASAWRRACVDGGGREPGGRDRSCSQPAPGAGRSRACPSRSACRCGRSRARSCGCAIPPVRGCCDGSCASTAAISCRAPTARYVLGATVEERGFDSRRPPAASMSCCATPTSWCPGSASCEIEELSSACGRAPPTTRP